MYNYTSEAAENARLFIESIFEACQSLKRSHPDWWVLDENLINSILSKYRIGYQIRGFDLLPLESQQPQVPVPPAPPTLEQQSLELYQKSLNRSAELLDQGRPREAVQEILWLLETVSTAFKGLETDAGSVAGKYFNHIARDLKRLHPGTPMERAIEWVTALHGYLSSPGGGGVRHGQDLGSRVELSQSEGRLYCNLIRSYLGYLVEEHTRMNASQRI